MNVKVYDVAHAELSKILVRDIKKALRLFIKEAKTKKSDFRGEFKELEVMYAKIVSTIFVEAEKNIFDEGLKLYSEFEEPKVPDEF